MARVAINTGATPNDGTGDSLRAAGGIINNNFLEIYTHLGAGSTTILPAPIWDITNVGINTLKNVGIGTTNPRFALEVGAVGASGTTVFINGDTRVTGIVTANSFRGSGTNLTGIVTSIVAGTNVTISGSTGQVTINASGGGGSGISTQWITTNAGIHTLSNVGVGTTNPTVKLDVLGNVRVVGVVTAKDNDLYTEWNLGSNGSSDYTFSGPGFTGSEFDPTIYLVRGKKYKFTNTMGAHPFRIQSTPNGSVGTQYNDGITNNDVSNGTLTWEVRHNAPSTLYYQCTSHTAMGGVIYVLNEGTGGGSSQWITTNAGIHTLSNVGIGTTNPRFTLEVGAVGASGTTLLVNGDARVTGILTVGTSSIVLNGTTDTLTVPNLIVTNSTTGVTASGVGITVRDGGGNLGSASIIDFGDNLTVSFAAGIATITGAAGGGASSQWATTTAGINTTSNVGIGTTNPLTSLQVGRYGVSTSFGTFTASAGIAHTIDSFTISLNDFKTVEYTLHVGYGASIQAQKVLAMQNGTNAYTQEYAIMFEPSSIVSIASTVTSGQFRLQIIPEVGVNGLTTYRLTRQSML